MVAIVVPKMSDVLDTSRFALPSGALINAFEADEDAGSRSQLLERVRKHIEKGRATQKEWARAFDGLYEEAVSADFSAPSLMRWSAALLERERAALERLYPFLEDTQNVSELHWEKEPIQKSWRFTKKYWTSFLHG
jgi:hypothetical protein